MISGSFWKTLSAHPEIVLILKDPSDCWAYGFDNSKQHSLPEGVVFPTSTQSVQHIVKTCIQHQIPITARGRGTGTAGGAIPIQGGIVMCFEWMNKILEYNPQDRLMVVQPGVLNGDVQKQAATHQLLWGPDPSSQDYCTIGGNLAYNSAGPRAVYYGTPRENTLGLEVIDGAGRFLKTGFRTSKSVVGYDLTRLFIGSEGTLGIITEATLQLKSKPSCIQAVKLCYTSTTAALEAVNTCLSVSPLAIEFIDHQALCLIQQHHAFPLPEKTKAILLVEVGGESENTAILLEILRQKTLCPERVGFFKAQTEHERRELWAIRKAISPTLRQVAPNKINEDIVVPVSHLSNFIQYTETLSAHYDVCIINFGHAGNGNLHVNILYNAQNNDESQKAQDCLEKIFHKVIELGGTLSGEHGIGLLKKPFFNAAIPAPTLDAMKDIKKIFDPHNLLNPSKIWPD